MAELKKASVKSKVEAVLFSVGHKISVDEICRLCRAKKEEAVATLRELRREYDEKQSSLMLVEEGDFWKFTVRDHLISVVRRIVTETELTKSVLETLAVIAFKYPILQSDLIKIRTNKAYDHLVELEKSGYITRQKHSRTNLIKLTEKFFKYFDLTEEKLKDQFRDFDSIAKAIKEKEEDVERIIEEQHKRAEELKKQDEKIKKEIESMDKSGEEFEVPLQPYETNPKEMISGEFEKHDNLIVEKEKIGELEIINDEYKPKPVKEKPQAETEAAQQNEMKLMEAPQETKTEQIFSPAEKTEKQAKKRKTKRQGMKMTPEMEAK